MDNQTTEITNKNGFGRFLKPRYLVALVVVILLVEVFILMKDFKKVPLLPPPQVVQPIQGASMVLFSSSKDFKVGDAVLVSVRLVTGGHPVTGADLILKFDPNSLSVSSSAVKAGSIFKDYTLLGVDGDKGIVSASGTSLTGSFNGVGDFVNIEFKAKAVGETKLLVEFEKGKTSDSNIADLITGKDILEKVENLEVNIQ